MASLSKKEERKREGKATDRRLEASKFVLVMAIRKEEREGGKNGKKRQLGKCESSSFLCLLILNFLPIFFGARALLHLALGLHPIG
jgi:hypothetical protein